MILDIYTAICTLVGSVWIGWHGTRFILNCIPYFKRQNDALLAECLVSDQAELHWTLDALGCTSSSSVSKSLVLKGWRK